jgi:hypothetical protein
MDFRRIFVTCPIRHVELMLSSPNERLSFVQDFCPGASVGAAIDGFSGPASFGILTFSQ